MTQDDEDDGDLHPAALYSGGGSSHQHHHHYHNHHRPFSSTARQNENQRQGNGLQVRTIITDSNGHSSRYENPVDSRGQLHRRGSSGYGTSTISVGGGCGGSGGGVNSGGGGGGGYSTTGSSSNARRDSTKMCSSASSGRPDGGVAGGGSPLNAGSKSSGRTERRPSKDRRLSSTSSDQSNQSLKVHEAPLLEVAGLSLNPGAGSSHHSRAASFKEHKPSNELHVDEAALIQARRNSMPTVTNNLLAVPTGGGGGEGGEQRDTRLRRVRSFKTTSKGVVVNRGDSFKKKSTHSLMSTGSEIKDGDRNSRVRSSSNNNSALDLGSSSPTSPAYFRVNMMGAAGVGKTSLAHQFLTSEYIGHDDNDETHQMTVTVLLDGEESTIEFIDPPDRNVISGGVEQLMDAYVVVFAINEHASFEVAQNLVRFLRVDYGTDRAILLVANKIDLVRKRKVTADEARLVATTFDCKYVETSAALNHYVDELLVGIISQIRLQLSIPFTTIFFPGKEAGKRRKSKKPLCKGPRGFLNKLFRRGGFGHHGGKKDKAVDDLYTL